MSHMYQDIRELNEYEALRNQQRPTQTTFQPPPGEADNPFFRYFAMSQKSPAQQQQVNAQQFAQQIIGQPTQNVAQGVGQMIAGAGLGLANYQKQGASFPQAPGGAQPGLMTGLANFFTGRNNGGLK